ncbi:MAG: Asp-tRNA(Asn)/Glu-tRNA(Gln) amidotransferase subunit GatB [Clostridia bacterium]|nr:Asp-tRNA(Asn)/Glu-tRNA(Gln) amidotransferase subunit GatB [Clostridia bacterium]MBR3324928.1 Asp-tRNA(Asn)/Glu-tRNA(Gln) amidotransferase subunit GatB [Clostridia bacterium]
MSREDYEVVIGLEVHAELSTRTKIFCSCSTEFGANENTHVCPICTAMPGALPKLNEKVVEYAVKAGLATNCSISQDSKNDRKNYFYPDLPKSYQISQFDKPLCNHGYVEIEDDDGNKKKVRILRIHIEEDAGKLNHDEYSSGSLVDLNRAGVPLIEIVSEPDLRSSGEADRYLKKLKSILQYINVSDCKMEEGSLRADVNVSIHKPGTELGTRHEMKNINSFKAIQRAIEYEIDSQIDDAENGKVIQQETMRWDDLEGRTFPMRSKEDAQDYRYFPDPDLVAIKLSDEYINNIKENLPELPESRKVRYMEEIGLSEKDADALVSSRRFSDIFEEAGKICNDYKSVCNWLTSDISRILNEGEMDPEEIPFKAKELAELVSLINDGTISSKIGKKVLEELFKEPRSPKKIIEEKGWVQISDESEIKEVVMTVLEANPQSIVDFKAGKDRALGFLVGQAMKATKGKANPQMLNKMFLEELKK